MKNPNKPHQNLKVKIKPSRKVLIFSGLALCLSFLIFLIYANFGISGKANAGLGEPVTEATGLNSPNPRSLYAAGTAGLPVALLNFSGQQKQTTVQLEWITASETNNDYFTIDRSADGLSYTRLFKIKGAGNSSRAKSYLSIDETPRTGDNYYRLSQTDCNGKSVTFIPIHVRLIGTKEEDATLKAYPLPLNDQLKIVYSLREKGVVDFTLTNSEGRVIKSKQVVAEAGDNTATIESFSTLKKGVYLLVMRHGTQAKAIKVAKIWEIFVKITVFLLNRIFILFLLNRQS